MSRSIHSIARHFLNRDSVDECSLQEIRELAEKHPYSAPVQYLLLEKLRTEDPAGYQAQSSKAILYYHDPLAFQLLLNPGRFETIIDEENIIIQQPGDFPQVNEEENSSAVTVSEVDPVDEVLELNVNEAGGDRLNERETETEEEEREIETFGETETVVEGETEREGEREREGETEAEREREAERETERETETEAERERETGRGATESNSIEETTPAQEKAEEITIRPLNTGTPLASNDLVFDPYHTVDYFASQGIKLSQDEFSKDKFGKQLKSFTEWLKSMKRLPANEVIPSVDTKTEDKVHHLAEDSIHQSEVYTEAMADVWLKQGNKAKAIEVYNKLSLLNPSKKAYFAAQIENLKHS